MVSLHQVFDLESEKKEWLQLRNLLTEGRKYLWNESPWTKDSRRDFGMRVMLRIIEFKHATFFRNYVSLSGIQNVRFFCVKSKFTWKSRFVLLCRIHFVASLFRISASFSLKITLLILKYILQFIELIRALVNYMINRHKTLLLFDA